MYIILGGTGHIGSSVAQHLLREKQNVTIITRDAAKTAEWEQKGAKAAVVDVLETDRLREVFKTGKRLFLLNPPADSTTDTVRQEHRTLFSILDALKNSGIEKVVAESTYGAQPGQEIGDLGILYEMEEQLRKMDIYASVIRGAYYMSNWDTALETAQKEGIVHTLYPPDFKLPMVAPQNIGQIAAQLLAKPIEETGLHFVEGPQEYSSADVAAAFGKALNKSVKVVQTPEEKWISALMQLGFSDKAARSMAAMTKLTLEDTTARPQSPIRGATTLDQYIESLVTRKSK